MALATGLVAPPRASAPSLTDNNKTDGPLGRIANLTAFDPAQRIAEP
jgi:hypothetical protein